MCLSPAQGDEEEMGGDGERERERVCRDFAFLFCVLVDEEEED